MGVVDVGRVGGIDYGVVFGGVEAGVMTNLFTQFDPGDEVVITRVPELAERWQIQIGTSAVIQTMSHLPGGEDAARIRGLVLINIQGFDFWWHVDDLKMVRKKSSETATGE